MFSAGIIVKKALCKYETVQTKRSPSKTLDAGGITDLIMKETANHYEEKTKSERPEIFVTSNNSIFLFSNFIFNLK